MVGILTISFWGMMVPLARATVCSHRLSIQTTVVPGTVWPQSAIKVLSGGCGPPVLGKGMVPGVGDWSPEQPNGDFIIGSCSNIGYLSPFSQCFDLSQTDCRTELVQQKTKLCTKVQVPPKTQIANVIEGYKLGLLVHLIKSNHRIVSDRQTVASILAGSWGQDPANFFPCPGPHIGGPRLDFTKYKFIIKLVFQ